LGPADADVIPGIGCHADLVPQILAVESREADVVGRQRTPRLAALVIRDLTADRLDLAVLLLHLADEVAEIEHVFLVEMRSAGSVKGKDIVPSPRGNLSRGACRQLQMWDVVNRNGDAVLLSPVRREAIEPFIVLGHEMAPLKDLQRLGLGESR